MMYKKFTTVNSQYDPIGLYNISYDSLLRAR